MRFALALLALISCTRAVRSERREQPVDTGVAVAFSAEAERTWDFGDGSAPLTGQAVRHAFVKAGRYEVKAFDAEQVTDVVSVIVQPRSAFHAVLPSAGLAVVARGLDDVAPTIDFLERVGITSGLSTALDQMPMLQFLLAPGAASSTFDRLEGAGAFTVGHARISFVGVIDEAAAAKAFGEFLVDHGWTPEEQGAYSRRGTNGLVFVDRGTLYFASDDEAASLTSVRHRIVEAPALGLDSDVEISSALADAASGGVVLMARANALEGSLKPKNWSVAVGALDVKGDGLRLIAKFSAAKPLWSAPATLAAKRLLNDVPQGPIAAASIDVPVSQVLEALGLDTKRADGEKSKSLVPGLADDDDEVRAGLAVLSRRIELALYFDVDEFLAATLRGGGRPAPRVTLLGETDVPDRALMKGAIERVLSRRRAPYADSEAAGVKTWNTLALDQSLELVLGAKLLSARWGRGVVGIRPIDMIAELAKRSESAAGPGHLTLFVDVGQLARDLLEPRQVPGLDPRKVVATQALTSTFLTQLTSLDQIFLDVAPTPKGATLYLEVRVSRRE